MGLGKEDVCVDVCVCVEWSAVGYVGGLDRTTMSERSILIIIIIKVAMICEKLLNFHSLFEKRMDCSCFLYVSCCLSCRVPNNAEVMK